MLLKLLSKRRYRLVLFFIVVIAALWLLDRCFPLALEKAQPHSFATVVFDRDDRPLRAFPDTNGVWRYKVSLDEVSPYYLEALLTYEDRRFWYHPGVDPVALIRAAVLNIKHQRVVSGGSTISMQVARLLHPHSRTVFGKLYQVVRTLQLEWHLSKREILTLYCNIAPFGGTIEGVQAASFTYLNKPARDLTQAEAALLAVLPQSPTKYRPDLHPNAAQIARNKVLDRMIALHAWNSATVNAAKLEQVFSLRHTPQQNAPLLSRRLLSQGEADSSQRIFTTVEGELQRSLQDYVNYYVNLQAPKTSAAVLVVENDTANVIAYVGTADFGNPERFGHVDMVTAIRSPGSTLKPFLYALALDDGLIHSQSLLSDVPQSWQDYRPGNFSGGFAGPVSASDALQRSLNVPAVQLFDRYGPKKFAAQLHNGGINLQMPNQEANLAVILGGVGISLEALVTGYMAFANQGKTKALRYTRMQPVTPERYLFSEQAAWVTQNILAGVTRPNGVKAVAALQPQNRLAWKTGTSFGFRDSWAVGVDRKYTIGVWLGRPDGTALPGNTGRLAAGPLLHTIADYLPDSRRAIVQPDKIVKRDICWPLGKLKTETTPQHCHQTLSAWIINDTVPPTFAETNSNQLNPFTFWFDAQNKHRINSGCHLTLTQDLQKSVALWPAPVEPWIPYRLRRAQQIPDYVANCDGVPTSPQGIHITGIEGGTRFKSPVNQNLKPRLDLMAVGGDGNQHWYINGRFHHSSRPLAKMAFNLALAGENQILVVDDAGNTDMVQVILE